jgi:hypothetical protein
MLDDPSVFDPVKVDVNAGVAFMRSPGRQEDEVSLLKQELNLVNCSIMRNDFHIAHERAEAIGDTGLMAYAIVIAEKSREHVMATGNVERLVILQHKCLVLIRVFEVRGLGRPIDLRVPALVRRTRLGREGSMLDDKAVCELKDVKKDAVALHVPVSLT